MTGRHENDGEVGNSFNSIEVLHYFPAGHYAIAGPDRINLPTKTETAQVFDDNAGKIGWGVGNTEYCNAFWIEELFSCWSFEIPVMERFVSITCNPL